MDFKEYIMVEYKIRFYIFNNKLFLSFYSMFFSDISNILISNTHSQIMLAWREYMMENICWRILIWDENLPLKILLYR